MPAIDARRRTCFPAAQSPEPRDPGAPASGTASFLSPFHNRIGAPASGTASFHRQFAAVSALVSGTHTTHAGKLWSVVAAITFLTLTVQGADKNGVSPNAISLPKGPGSIEGLGESFQPTLNTGTAKYGMALDLPPGTAGHGPAMRLSYEGGSGNGVLGFGWHLALPMIQRRSDQGIPLYGEDLGLDRADRFLNESKEELVPLSDGYFRCENEGAFVRYRFLDDHWEGTAPDGTRLEFGLTESSRIQDAATGRVFAWLLERQTDTHGNTIVYAYRAFAGDANRNQKYLSTVSYGPGGPPWQHFHFVTLEYEDRSDWFEDCRSGFVVRCGKRIKRILVGTQGVQLAHHLAGDWNSDGTTDVLNRQYELSYSDYAGASSHWSLLSTVEVIGADGASRLPPTTFGYAVCDPPDTLSAAGKVLGGIDEPPVVMDNPYVELADLNGDALPDLLQTFAGDLPHRAFLNLGLTPDAGALAWMAPQEISGDGRTRNFNLQSTVQTAHLSDLDGDGLADLVVKAVTGEVFFFGNEGRLRWGDRQFMSVSDVAPPSPYGQPGVRTADLDFDKRMDVIQSLNLGAGVVYRIWFNLGDQRYAPSVVASPADALDLTDPTVQIADLNGDRVPDLVRILSERLQVLTGLGYGRFTEATSIPLPEVNLTPDQMRQVKLADLTGDGIADLVLERAAPGQLWYWVNLGNYQFGARKEMVDLPLLVGQSAAVRWADMNGNGTTDLVYADATALPRLQTVDVGELINCGTTPNVLTSIANGLGRTTTIAYRSSVEFRLADAAAGHSWTNPMPISVPVVSRVTVDDSLGHQYVTEFHYHDGYYDTAQKQFRGFARVEQVELGDPTAPTLVTRHHFDTGELHEPMKGKLLRQSAEELDGRVYWEETVEWTVPPRILDLGTNGQTISYVHPIAQSRVTQELGQGVERRTESEMEFDQYGNQTLEASYGVVEDGNRAALLDERIAATEYALNLEAWLLRFPMRQETRDLEGNVISRTDYYYDDIAFSGDNPGVVSLGNLTLQREWIDPADPRATIESARYLHDPYGNATAVLDPLAVAPGGLVDPAAGHVRTIEYDGHFHTYAVTETVHPGAGAEPLVFRATYDEAFGSVITATDSNTNTTRHNYDAFARLISIIKPGDTPEYPTSEYRYALAVPVGAPGLVNYVESRLLDQAPGSRPTQPDHYLISREFTDGLGRKLMVKKEAESPTGEARPTIVVSSAVTFNARRTTALALNPFFSLAIDDGDEGLAYEPIEHPDWRGLFHESGNLVSLGLAEAHKTASLYDATLRERRSVNPDGGFEITAYEPLLTRSYDANQSDPASPHFGAHLARVEDGLGRLIRVDENVRIEDDGTPAGTLNTWTTRYEYDLNDQLTRITDSQNNVKLMAYDGLTRKTLMNDPDRGLLHFAYDAAGNLLETVDAKGQRITYTFDGANRLRTEDYHDGNPHLPEFDPLQPITPANRPDVAFFYDVPTPDLDLGDGTTMTALNTAGMLAYVWDLTGEEHYSYDARERATTLVKRIRDPLHGRLVSYRTGYAFDGLDRITQVLYPDDDFVHYEYNERGLGRRILGGPSGSLISNLRYSPAGQLTLIEYGNGVITRSAYDANLRLARMRTHRPPLDLEHVAFAYEFDAASNFRAITDLRPSAAIPDGSPRRNTQVLEFDDLYRLTGVRYAFGLPEAPPRNDGEIRYRYDRIGNLLAQTSSLQHLDRGFPVTDLGSMEYGGAAGRADRLGRAGADPPGPHALTEVRNPSFGVRTYPYDANGNMLEIDGLHVTWDFEDRLTTLETPELRAEYGYDHRDARITKRVTPKAPGGVPAEPTDSTVYVNQYFEIRQNNVATKYVWCGNTRIARVTATLSTDQLRQRLRLWTGWNLCALAVTAERAREQLAMAGAVATVFRWEAAEGVFREVAPSEVVSAGTVLWIEAVTNTTVTVRGSSAQNVVPSIIPSAGAFHPGALLESLSLDSFAPATAAIWRFDAAAQRWQARLSEALSGLSDLPKILTPGEGVFIRVDAETALSLPDESRGIRYYHQDHLGSSAVTTDADGVALEETCFYPFGFPRHQETTLGVSDPYQFIQRERDRESGLNCLEARFQSPVLGRFLRVDPLAGALKTSWLQEPQRLNLYAYCANSPFANSDPTGTDLLGTIMGAQNAITGFQVGVVEAAWEARPRDPVTTAISATVAVHQTLKAKGNQMGDIAYAAIAEKDYKKAALIAITDERVTKIMDPRTSDFEMGRVIGNETGKALVIIASAAAGGGGPKGPVPPPARPPPLPPAKVVVGRPMSMAGQTAKTLPPSAAKTVRDPTLPTGPANQYGLGRLAEKYNGGKLKRMQWEAANDARLERWSQEWSRRVEAARPEMDKMVQETGSAKPILKRISQEVDRLGIGPID